MLVFDGLGGFLVLAMWVFCFIDVLLTPENLCRSLPKLAWVFLVLLIPFLGSIAWLVAGRPWDRRPQEYVSSRSSSQFAAARPVQRRGVATNPDDDEEFLAGLRKRAEEQRQRAREQQDREPDA